MGYRLWDASNDMRNKQTLQYAGQKAIQETSRIVRSMNGIGKQDTKGAAALSEDTNVNNDPRCR